MAMMVVSMGTTVSAAETQDRGAELIQMEEEAQELDGFTGIIVIKTDSRLP